MVASWLENSLKDEQKGEVCNIHFQKMAVAFSNSEAVPALKQTSRPYANCH